MIKKSDKLILEIIRRKKEIYYPLFTILLSYLFYWICILFISLADSQVVLPFLLLSIAIIILVYSFDIYKKFNDNAESFSKKKMFILIFIATIISIIAILRLLSLILMNFYYLIPTCVHFLAFILVYFILRKEVKNYYSKKNKQIDE